MIFSVFHLAIIASIASVWLLVNAFQRVFLSPLRRIPGPRCAAVSGIWLWMRDLTGEAPKAIKDLHVQYGAIVRIGPNELSIDDPEVHNNVLYCQAPKFMKASYFYDPFKTGPAGIFQTTDSKEHSQLRRLVSRPFSRTSIIAFEPQIRASTEHLVDIIINLSAQDKSFCLSKMTRCLSLDFISSFVYGDSIGALDSPDFNNDVLDAFDSFAVSNFLFMMLPSLRRPSIAFLSILPFKVFQAIPAMRNVSVPLPTQAQRTNRYKQVNEALESSERITEKSDETKFEPLLQSARNASISRNHPLSRDFFVSDGLANIFAGTDTTSVTLTLTLLEVFCNEQIYARLHDELRNTIPEQTGLADLGVLETLPFLTACIKEGLRYSTPVRSRLPRVVPPSGWEYYGHSIPGGTLISSSPYLMNYNANIFPNPEVFDPERWLTEDPLKLKTLDNGLGTFSRGSRGCIGINLATAEVYITVAAIIRRFKLGNKPDRDLEIREIFGVIFDKPISVLLTPTRD